jgi:hypothetical protein
MMERFLVKDCEVDLTVFLIFLLTFFNFGIIYFNHGRKRKGRYSRRFQIIIRDVIHLDIRNASIGKGSF